MLCGSSTHPTKSNGSWATLEAVAMKDTARLRDRRWRDEMYPGTRPKNQNSGTIWYRFPKKTYRIQIERSVDQIFRFTQPTEKDSGEPNPLSAGNDVRDQGCV